MDDIPQYVIMIAKCHFEGEARRADELNRILNRPDAVHKWNTADSWPYVFSISAYSYFQFNAEHSFFFLERRAT